MAATVAHSVIIVFWKETAFPCWRAMDRRWKRNVVSLESSVITVVRRPISNLLLLLLLLLFQKPETIYQKYQKSDVQDTSRMLLSLLTGGHRVYSWEYQKVGDTWWHRSYGHVPSWWHRSKCVNNFPQSCSQKCLAGDAPICNIPSYPSLLSCQVGPTAKNVMTYHEPPVWTAARHWALASVSK